MNCLGSQRAILHGGPGSNKSDIYFNKIYVCNIACGLLMVREKAVRCLEKSVIIIKS